ncbi:Enoyl-CoA delta isomerase 1,peroxisomal [Lachnellula cervina]|uniref:Enoyl-CoA delta isomerase 1,peroxisomal n=1 Tax=Lachnellula cervina TaxID=1316786 RepID=A0A7D8YIE0_9HELO|nr:Enoyl-CoA delta isomerase 1,peroxisomal [Lachnellula cervina]
MATKTLFELPILSSPTATSASGTVIVTTSTPGIYLLTFTSPPDNRLLTPFCQTLLLALDIIEHEYPPGVLITTSGIQKFYSNGLDLEHASSTKGFFHNSLFALFRRLLTYPMPTIALVNGHAFAGGFMLAMYHDYRIFNPSRGFLCLNELDLGVPLRPAMSSIFRQKLTPSVYKPMVLEAKRFSAKEALEGGIVDALGGLEEAVKFVGERGLVGKAKTGVYGVLKKEMYRETLGYLEGSVEEDNRMEREAKKEDKRGEEARGRVKEWKRNTSGAAKL